MEYLENENNDRATAVRLISHLADPKPESDWQLFCNLLKVTAWTLNSKEFLIGEACQRTVDTLLQHACECICRG